MSTRIFAIVLFTTLGSALAQAQTTYFTADFACSDETTFGTPAGIFGWQATYTQDAWTTDLNGGVSANRDESDGGFGAPVDDYESFLVTGHPSWADLAIEATLTNNDDDSMGLVVRYGGPDAYYACYATKHQGPVCAGSEDVGTLVALIRVDAGQACTNGYAVATDTTFAYAAGTPYRFRLSAIGSLITCEIDVDTDGTLGSAGDLTLSYDDPAPFTSGLAGLYNFDNGEPDGAVIFDDVLIYGFDTDTDGDGLPDAVESDIGTDPARVDSDRDGISDRDEMMMPAFPPDDDGDARLDGLDRDSDGDGILDIVEAGDTDLSTPPRDTDCDGIPDARDTDSDGDNTPDSSDTCPYDSAPQTDTDGDGSGDACDAAPSDPASCGDLDADTCDDCSSGAFDPANDGPDSDADGICDSGGGPTGPTGPTGAGGGSEIPGFLDADGDGLDDRLKLGGGGAACSSSGTLTTLGWGAAFGLWALLRATRRRAKGDGG